jgi:oligopeptide/dipeptide ABC transporter ATP-binding protein
MTAPPILRVEGLRFAYRQPDRAVTVLREVALAVGRGEAVGLVGESGSGKSTLARAVLGLTNPAGARIEAGRIDIDGRDVTAFTPAEWERLRGHPVAMIFQDPLTYLNPVMRIGRQIGESVARHDAAAEVRARIEELLGLVRLPPGIARAYPHELSGGMRQRVLLAVALGCRPRLLIADEPTTALDVTTQAEIMALLAELRDRLGMALLLISHDLGLVASACSRIYVLYAGQTVEWGPTARVFGRPAHPYTDGLLRSARAERDRDGRFATIGGDVPNPAALPDGCAFRPRCRHAHDRCATMPGVSHLDGRPAHAVRCWHVEEEVRTRAAGAAGRE